MQATLKKQINKFGDLDDDLTELVLLNAPVLSSQTSLIESIISMCTPDRQDCESITSTNQIIYEFYKHILVYISKGGMFLQKSYEMIELLSHGKPT